METARSFSLRVNSYDLHFSEEMSRKATTVDLEIYDRLSAFVQTFSQSAKVLDIGAGAGIESWIIENAGGIRQNFLAL